MTSKSSKLSAITFNSTLIQIIFYTFCTHHQMVIHSLFDPKMFKNFHFFQSVYLSFSLNIQLILSNNFLLPQILRHISEQFIGWHRLYTYIKNGLIYSLYSYDIFVCIWALLLIYFNNWNYGSVFHFFVYSQRTVLTIIS